MTEALCWQKNGDDYHSITGGMYALHFQIRPPTRGKLWELEVTKETGPPLHRQECESLTCAQEEAHRYRLHYALHLALP